MTISEIDSNPAGRIAAGFLEALAASDTDAIAEMWTDDAVLEFPFAPKGFPTRVEGRPAIEKYFRDALTVVSPIDYPNQVITPLAVPDACLIEFGSRLTVGDDPTVFENSYITIVRVHAGRIAHFKEHYDSVKRVQGFPSASETAGEATPSHIVTVHLRSHADTADALARLMRDVSAQALDDPGCRSYRVVRSLTDPADFMIFEAWDSESDFNRHMAADWVTAVNAKMMSLLAGEVKSQPYSDL